MLNILDELGYNISHNVLVSKDFGVPQNRQRIYIVGSQKKLNITFKFPIGKIKPTKVLDILEHNVDSYYTISDKMWIGHKNRKLRHQEKGNGFGYSLFKPEDSYVNTISARYWKDGSEALIDQK